MYELIDCYNCGGSGEGMFDDTTCRVCKGRGERLVLKEDDDENEDAEDSQEAVDE